MSRKEFVTGRSLFLVHKQKEKDEQIEQEADRDGATEQCIHDQEPSVLDVVEIQTIRNETTHLQQKAFNILIFTVCQRKSLPKFHNKIKMF